MSKASTEVGAAKTRGPREQEPRPRPRPLNATPSLDPKSPAPIQLPALAVESILDAQRKLDEINAKIGSYAMGLRHGLDVPEDWLLDMNRRAFVPPAHDESRTALT